jgi:diacylglycerol kinase family enzyme
MANPPEPSRSRARRKRKQKADADIVLVCNPRAGGRWKELAGILDSEEAEHVRRIVTDSVEDIAEALAETGQDAKLLCIYGGDGTIQRILDRLPLTDMHLAMIGGGTMNVTSRWCGFSSNPADSFRHVVRGYRSGELMFKEIPLLEVRTGNELRRGFTFGMGPIIHLLDAYENGRKGKIAAIGTAVRAVSAVWTPWPRTYRDLLALMKAEVHIDGDRVPHEAFSAVFANVTGQINPGVEPFVDERTRDRFFCAALAVSAREFTVALPMIARGWMPPDKDAFFQPHRLLERFKNPALFSDPRYVNKTGKHLDLKTSDTLYTVDGEIMEVHDGAVSVNVGPMVRLAVGPQSKFKQLKTLLSR